METINISKINRDNNIKRIIEFLSPENAKILEQSIFDFSYEYCKDNSIEQYLLEEIYQTKFNSIINNINPNSYIKNNYLLTAINNNMINLIDIPYMRPEDIFPENWKNIKNKLILIEEKRKNMNIVELFPCKKCGCKKHTIKQMQTRGCDEPMTTFITCQTCGNTVKKG
jgi:DNA-directed RNA polymerase subunit M/transcription elongation factor TFIIS